MFLLSNVGYSEVKWESVWEGVWHRVGIHRCSILIIHLSLSISIMQWNVAMLVAMYLNYCNSKHGWQGEGKQEKHYD